MQMTEIHPVELKGIWAKGYALDMHTLSSDYIGDNEFGHPMFETEYSPMGGLVKQIKYRSDLSVLDEITKTAVGFLKNQWQILPSLNIILPIPPSNMQRSYQPVMVIADKISEMTNVPISGNTLIKTRPTPELKDEFDSEKRKQLLSEVFRVKNQNTAGKNVLLFDDLFRSGITVNMAAEVLYNEGKVNNVFLLTLTKTRVKR